MEGWTIAELQTLVRILAGAFIYMGIMFALAAIQATRWKHRLLQSQQVIRQERLQISECPQCSLRITTPQDTARPKQRV